MAKQTYTTGQVLTAAQMTTLQANDYNQTVSAKTANYVLVAADAGTRITMSNASATTITVNTGLFTAGDTLIITNIGAGVTTITAGTATVSTSASLALNQYDSGTLYFSSTGVAIWTGANIGDITGVTAGTGLTGGGSSGAVTLNLATTAKGDLVAGTGASTATALTVGNNGETLVADSSTSTGLRYQSNFAAGKNKCLNSDFSIWQRGTSFSANVYTADRWKTQTDKTVTVSQQTFTPGTAPVAGYEGQYFLRQAYSAGGSYGALQTRLEDVRIFAGQTMTFSYWAKADSTVSNTPSINQNFGSGGSTQVSTNGTTHNITTSWARYSSTISVPSVSGKTIGTSSYFELQPILLVSGSASTIDIWGVQVEASNTATAFQTATGTIQGELAACQRYFQMSYQQGVTPGTNTASGANRFRATASTGQFVLETAQRFIVPLRVSPTLTWYSTAGTSGKITNNGSDLTVSASYDYSSTVSPYAYTASSISAGNDVQYHFTASAEL
jgi:hypothetical protein